MSRFDSKVVFITGASSGLGKATAERLASEGATIFGVGRNESSLASVKSEIEASKGVMTTAVCDIADVIQCQQAISECIETYGQLDVLLNIAGKHNFRHSTDVSVEDWEQDLAVNVSGPFYLAQAAIPHLLQVSGNIVNVASIAGLQGQAYSAGYCTAKHGLLGLTKSLALEYMNQPLRVNALCPGGMDTPQVQNITFPENADFDLVMRSAAVRGMMDAADVAAVIAFLASDDAKAVHGAVYTADMGKTVG
jgi:NAD(P)-dependent dehydrogenase (short-subunit alcohol dehydrogenase family)